MKVGMRELRGMVAEAVRRSLVEAKRKGRAPKEVPHQTEEAAEAAAERKVRGTGYSHSPANDYSEPLGDANLYKSQGAANFGNLTGVGPTGPVTAEQVLRKMREGQLRRVIRAMVSEALRSSGVLR